jgi:peptidoglycan-associated lipoprotein
MTKSVFKPLLLALALLPLVGCETVGTKDGEASVEDRTAAEEQARLRGLGKDGKVRPGALDDPSSPLSRRAVYFDYDSSEIRAEDRAVVEAHAAYLRDNQGAGVTLEGHTDERGTREYNVGLGERRAQAVQRLLVLLGAGNDQLRTVSYGEERPAEEGQSEHAWQLNRRVELVYRGG